MRQSLFVTIKLNSTLHQTRPSMKEPNTLKLIVFREKVLSKKITTDFVNFSNQLAYVFTKSLRSPRKLGAYDIYAPA